MAHCALFRQYRQEKCDHEGNQKSNLTKTQEEGLKKVRKRVKDKSGNLAVMSRRTYVEAGIIHTREDLEVGWDNVKDSQRELNWHVRMLIKVFKIG